MSENIGFIGLGMMGLPMSTRLIQAGYQIVGWDINEIARQNARNSGVKLAESCSEVSQRSDVVLAMLPSSKEVEEIVLGKDGILYSMHKDSVFVDMSTSYPPATSKIAKKLKEKDISMLDAPVAGGVIGAKQGSLCIMIGGDKLVYQRCQNILSVLGSHIFYMGGTASGHTMKLVNNYLAALSVAATGEAYSLAIKAGLDASTVSEVLKVSSGRNYATEFKFPQYVLPRKFDDGFRLELYVKDLNLLHQISKHFDINMPIGEAVRLVYQRASDLGYGPESHTNIIRMIEQDAGVIIGD